MINAIELQEEEDRLKESLRGVEERREQIRKRFADMGMEVSSFTSVIIVN